MARDRGSLISQLVSCTAMRRFYSQLQQMPQSCHCSRLSYPHWPRLDLGVTCPSVQPTRVALRSRPVMARSQSGCPTGRPLMRLVSRRRGRLWRYAYAVSASPASGGPATTGFHPASSEKPERPCARGKAAFGRPLHFRLKQRNGRKKRAPRRQPNFGDKLVTLMEYEAVRAAHRARPCRVRSSCMMLRVWMVGALAALPFLVSGALAQTPASPPATATSPAPTTSPAPAADPTSAPAS